MRRVLRISAKGSVPVARVRMRGRSGQTLVEFAAVLLAILTVLFGVFETSRLLFTYATLAEAARAGARYAAVHGADCTGGCVPSTGVGAVQNLATAAGITLAATCPPICVTYTYPHGATTPVPGTLVNITVTYTFAPVTPLLFWNAGVPLSSTTQSIITY